MYGWVVGLKRKQAEGQFDLFSDLEDAGEDDAGMGDEIGRAHV